MKAHVFKMTCLTNLHVGNGDVNYSIIDNEVEKDAVFGTPVIPSSGIKGALRSYAEEKQAEIVREVFGDGDTRGGYKFLAAQMLGRPVRVSKGGGAYVVATSPELLESFASLCREIGAEIPELEQLPAVHSGFSGGKAAEAEGITLEKEEMHPGMKKLFGEDPWMVLTHEELCGIQLPVIARNALDINGESQNLWYEEYVPHHSVFYLPVLTPGDEMKLQIEDEVVQFGADASIGYGLMKIEKLA